MCVGETLQQYESNQTAEVVARQIRLGLAGVDPAFASRIVLAYEPVWAIGTGRTPTNEEIARMHAHLRRELVKRFGESGSAIAILYGGSVNPRNAMEILAVAEVGGALVGGASLKAADFLAIIEAAPKSLYQ